MRARFPWALALFLYVWLMVGFATGTATLLGPVRWITASLRASSWREREDAVMIGVILIYVAVSFLIARLLVGWMRRSRSTALKYSVPAVATLAAAVSLWGWLNPAAYARAAGGSAERFALPGGGQFVFGPYPDASRLAQLKAEGFTGVVSLQHPAVVPFEPQGIAAEKEETARLQLEFVHAPMLPWVSSNEDSLEKIRSLAAQGGGRYYIHCGLGRDRTNVVKRMLERMGAQVATTSDFPEARTFAKRRADRGDQMERGTFRELEADLWLIPYPNQHELYGNMLAGQVAHVLLILDSADREQARWIEEASGLFRKHEVPFTVSPLRAGDQEEAGRILAALPSLPRPLVVIVPYTRPRPNAEVADTLLLAYGLRAGEQARAGGSPAGRSAR